MDTSTAEKIIETDSNYEFIEGHSKFLLNDEHKDLDVDSVNTSSRLDVDSNDDSVSIITFPELVKSKNIHTETINSWFMGKVTQIYWDEGYFVAELKDIDTSNINVAEFDIDSAFENTDDAELKLFVGASFAFYVVTRHGMGSPLTVTGLEFTTPYIWQEKDNDKVNEIYREIFPD